MSSSQEHFALEHVIGFSGKYTRSLISDTVNPNIIMFTIGSVVAIGDISDPHNQTFLRKHDEDITIIEQSPSGKLLASAQLGSTKRKGSVATIVIWNVEKKIPIHVLEAHTVKVLSLSFSHDDRFLVSTGEDNTFCVWDMENGALAGGQKFEKPSTFAMFCPKIQEFNTKRPKYFIITGNENNIRHLTWNYEVKSMQFVFSQEVFKMPGRLQGFKRAYTASCMGNTSAFCLVGTAAGEVIVLHNPSLMFRTSFQANSHGILAMCCTKNGETIFTGGGDGRVKKMSGSDQQWQKIDELQLTGKITSLSLMNNELTLVIGTDCGEMYLLSAESFKDCRSHSESHINGVTCVAFGESSDEFCTSSRDGTIKLWDLSDYTVKSSLKGPSPAKCVACYKGVIVSGWQDGFIRAFDVKTTKLKWQIVNAHKGPITCIAINDKYIATGGEDAAVRIFSTHNQEMLGQFTEHTKKIVGIRIDIQHQHILHTCSSKAILTYDLKTNKRISSHSQIDNKFTDMVQTTTGENELVLSRSDGKFWDIDYKEPVKIFEDDTKSHLSCLAVSPSGKLIASGGHDLLLKIWDVQSGQLIVNEICHSRAIRSVAWTPDEKQLISVSDDGAIAIWNNFLTC